jgi:hypothetical protein
MLLEPIMTFNSLFVEAKQRGFKMERLCEDDHGFWFCTWRKGGQFFGPVSPRRQPFIAAHDAFMVTLEASDGLSMPDMGEPQASDDLFG